LCYPRVVSPNKSTFDIQLDECRAEWRRRHPPTEQSGRDVELVRHRELGMAGTLRSQLTFLFFPFLCGPTGRTRCRVVEGGPDRPVCGLNSTLPVTYHRLAAKMTRIQRQVESFSFKGVAL
jgi:hypothetical protein